MAAVSTVLPCPWLTFTRSPAATPSCADNADDSQANGATAVPLGNVARLTGRQPRTLEAYLQEHLRIFQNVPTGAAIHSV